MQKQIFLILTILAACFQPLSACDCTNAGDFAIVASMADFVGTVKITKYLTYKIKENGNIPQSMEVEVVKKYKGTEVSKKIIVWGDNGNKCRPYLSTFKVGNYYAVALHSMKVDPEYFISNCGEYWLEVNKSLKYAYPADKAKQKILLKSLEYKVQKSKINIKRQ